MTYKTSLSPSREVENAAQSIDDLEDVVVYICPNGYAQLKREEKPSLEVKPNPSQRQLQVVPLPLTKPSSKPLANHPLNTFEATKNAQLVQAPEPLAPSVKSLDCLKTPNSVTTSSVKSADDPANDLGKKLVRQGVITQTQLEVAKYDMSFSGMELVEVLVARGWVTPDAIASL